MVPVVTDIERKITTSAIRTAEKKLAPYRRGADRSGRPASRHQRRRHAVRLGRISGLGRRQRHGLPLQLQTGRPGSQPATLAGSLDLNNDATAECVIYVFYRFSPSVDIDRFCYDRTAIAECAEC